MHEADTKDEQNSNDQSPRLLHSLTLVAFGRKSNPVHSLLRSDGTKSHKSEGQSLRKHGNVCMLLALCFLGQFILRRTRANAAFMRSSEQGGRVSKMHCSSSLKHSFRIPARVVVTIF